VVAAQVFELKEESLSELRTKLAEAERGACHYEEIAALPSPQFLTDTVMKKLDQWLVRSFEDHADHRYELLRRFARARANRFIFGVGEKPLRTDIFMSRTQMFDLLFRLLPAIGCTPSERDALVEFWVFDCLRNRNVHFGIFDSPLRGMDRTPNERPTHDTVTLFDRRYALLRRRGMPGMLWVDSAGTIASAPAVIKRYGAQIDAARTAVAYDFDSQREVEHELTKLLSRRTWAYRSRNAKAYRTPCLN
jgi:hypothetical protein